MNQDEVFSSFLTETRPWGSFTQLIKNTPATVKIITVHENEVLSLQYHNHRSELWKILEGNGFVVIGEEIREAKKGDFFFIPEGTHHRIGAHKELVFLEIAFGEFDEADIVRLEDKYQRI